MRFRRLKEANLKTAKDKDVVEYAGKHDLILVTEDQKPAELAS
jgi:predicted nuclease of predicted toxin-antitoxin system